MALSSIIGQIDAKARLVTALRGVPGHAYVFAGPDGIGKTLLAREFAKALLCQNPTDDGACGDCPSCHHYDYDVHPDFRCLMLEPKEKNIKVERVRQAISADLAMRPQYGKRKVYLIAADYLNEQGQNALLKSLEEPPEFCIFLLTVIGPERLLPTILSRVSLISLRRYSVPEIACILTAHGCPDGASLDFYARFAGGLAGVAIDLATCGWFGDLRTETISLFKDLALQNRTSLLTAGYQFFDNNRPHTPVIFDILGSLIRDQLVYVTSRKTELLTNQDQLPLLTKIPLADHQSADVMKRLTRAYTALIAARRGLSLNASYESLICNLLLNLRKEFHYA